MYKKVSASLDFVPREKEVLEFWKANGIFEKSVEQSKGKPAYTFYDGPPTANGRPHIGHVLTRSMKDIIPLNLKWKSCSDWTARNRSRVTACFLLLTNARSRFGNIKANGNR